MAKQLTFEEEARQKILAGVTKAAKAVKSTMGPAGRNVVLSKPFGFPVVTKDGVSVAKEIDLADPVENIGAQLIKEVASKTNDIAGDATTLSTVLTEAIYKEGLRNVTAGANAISIQRGINKAVNAAVEAIKGIAKPVDSTSEISQVATVSANWDSEIGNLIASAMEKVGKDGTITVEEAKGIDTYMEVVEGMQFDKGYLSPYFVTKADTMEAVLDAPMILLYEKKISSLNPILPALELVSKKNRSLFIIAEDIEGEALSALVLNNIRGALKSVAVKAPGFGERRKEIMRDIAALTGATFISDDLGAKLEDITLADFGSAKRVVVTKDTSVIVEGAGDPEAISARISQIKKQLSETTSEYDSEKLQERLAKLAGGIAILKIGAATETEMKEKKDRVDDALHATRAAVEEGIVPGGGVTLIRAQKAVEALSLEGDEATGAAIVKRAMEAPLRQLITNAGREAALIVEKVKELPDTMGYDIVSASYVNMFTAGVVDPAKVIRVALQNSSSVAGLMLTTECIVTDIKEEASCGCKAQQPTLPGMSF